MYDKDNLLIVEKEGTVDLPPVPIIPIVEHNIHVGNRVVDHAQFTFLAPTPAWYKIDRSTLASLRVSQENLSLGGARLSAVVSNDSLFDADNTTVVAVLFDSAGAARAAAKSVIDLPRKSSQPVVFTWPRGNPEAARIDIIALPSF